MANQPRDPLVPLCTRQQVRRARVPSVPSSEYSAAMELLSAGVDSSVIALWLGHESVETTRVYLDARLALKEAALG